MKAPRNEREALQALSAQVWRKGSTFHTAAPRRAVRPRGIFARLIRYVLSK